MTGDLALVARALDRDGAAVQAVDAAVRAAAASAARRLAGDHALADEIAQRVSERLWIGRDGGAPALRSYTGEAPLAAWLKIIAYREGIDLRRARETPTDDDLVDQVVVATEPHLATLRATYLAAFKRCFKAAFAALSLHDRDLVRRHHLDGLTLDALARMHGTHRATVARQLARVRERLVEETRRALRAELSASSDLEDILQLIGSKLEASLSREA
ncbi:MAG TPA: sigma-70 family RNA polymerase sigma factor [Kofleriaceae bacterium]|nr:sigma-70 family RNA polymerase sigma factor [Kofleriaceae bacterium]